MTHHQVTQACDQRGELGATPIASFDVAVVGGGPAGSTMATLLARAGHRVAIIERERHPRFHIGESLLPHTTPILAKLGILGRMDEVGIVKRGADFTEGGVGRKEIDFARALNPRRDAPNAFQVRRAEFDQLLFENAAAAGAVPFEGWAVREVALDTECGVSLELRGGEGSQQVIECRELVDASGRDGLLPRKLGLRETVAEHSSAAIYGHFEGAVLQTGRVAGNISIYWFEHGWFWMIPLKGGLMSVGAVCRLDCIKNRDVPLDQFFARTIARCPEVAGRLQDAERIGPVHAASNYSYGASAMSGPRWSLVGDAFAFVDPIFSSGVHFAMGGAEIIAEAVDARLRGLPDAEARMAMAERRVRRGLGHMSWLIYRFNSPAMRHLFLHPKNVLGVERALLAVLAGDIFGRTRIGWRLAVFKLIYEIHRRWLVRTGSLRLERMTRASRGAGRVLSWLAAAVVGLAGAGAAEPLTPERLAALLAARGPVQARFVEERTLAILTRPLRTEGTLAFTPPDRLIRQDLLPDPALYEIDGTAVTIRKGGQEERLELAQLPVLQGLVLPFQAVLAGDFAALEQSYNVGLSGDVAAWQLTLTPRDQALAAAVETVQVAGRHDRLTQVRIDARNGDSTHMELTAAP